jgi:hypothetical protein
MKLRGRCPKCQGEKIGKMPTRRETTAYVCTDCGFYEEYLDVIDVDWSLVEGFEWLPRSDHPHR